MLFRATVLLLLLHSMCRAGSIQIKLPPGVSVKSAVATMEKKPNTVITGTVNAQTVSFTDAAEGMAYEVTLTLTDGTQLAGVDMGWYSIVPDKKDAGPMEDDDLRQMCDVGKKVLGFFNVNDVVLVKGNHNRAVVLMQLVRDKPFHSDKGDDEVIWRPELWYFENHHGGWEKVLQTDRVLRRVRFETHAAYHAATDQLKWTAELGGLKPTPKNPDVVVELPKDAGTAIPKPGEGIKPKSDAPPTGDQP